MNYANRDELLEALSITDNVLPSFAQPGGYPLYYLTADDGVLCTGCANGGNGSEATHDEAAYDKQWNVVAQDIHWEGEPLVCAHCGAIIKSVYGPVE